MKWTNSTTLEWRVFLAVATYVVLLGVVLQIIILPLTPWHGGQGLMAGGDWLLFQKSAVEHATNIREMGWSVFEFKPDGHGPAGFAAYVYAVTGVFEPWVLLPLHGAIYGLAALGLFTIIRVLGGGGDKAAQYALLPMLLMPSLAMVWGQLHKDVWAMAAILLVLAFWAKLIDGSRLSWWLSILVLGFANAILLWMRPYTLQIMLLGQICMMLVLILSVLSQRKFLSTAWAVGAIAVTVAFIVLDKNNNEAPAELFTCIEWKYELPITYLDKTLKQVACTRSRLFEFSEHAQSNLDANVSFYSATDVLSYTPRALQIGVFAPFPNMWFDDVDSLKSKVFRLVSAVETLVMYGALLGLFLLFCLIYKKKLNIKREGLWVMVALLLFSVVWVGVYSVTTGNIGSIYRVRFPIMLLWIGMGILAWQRVWTWGQLSRRLKHG